MTDRQAGPDPIVVARHVAERLGEMDGVVAVVLGGSQARGAADERSDIDLGIYYHAASRPAVDGLRALAKELDDRHEDGLVTDYGEWGPWVNGGGWLRVDGWKVDLLYREIEKVAGVIEDCRAGRVSCDYYLGHPHGFHNHVYLGELATCVPLFDPGNAMTALKLFVVQYPPAMKRTIVERYLYDAQFMLDVARKPAERGDVFEVAGCLFRVVAALVQVLFAANERYFVNEKGALEAIGAFERAPKRFVAEARAVLARTGDTPERLVASVERAEKLIAGVREVASLATSAKGRRRAR